MSKITRLSAGEEQALREYIAERRSFAYSTEPADRGNAERQIERMYGWLGKPRPIMLWVDGPWHGFLAQAMLPPIILDDGKVESRLDSQLYWQLDSQLHSQLRSQLHSQLRSQLHSQLRSQLDSQLHLQLHLQLDLQLRLQLDSQLRSQLHPQLYSQFHSRLNSQLRSQLDLQLRLQLRLQLHSQLYWQLHSQLYSQLRSQLSSQLLWPWWGQFGSWWSFYDFPIRHLNIEVPAELAEKCDAWVQLSRSLGHFWAFDGIAILSERMSVCQVDGEGRLHSEDGPAMAYRDGTSLWASHGVAVSQQVIEAPETLTPQQIREEPNAEVRRVMLDRYGHDRYLQGTDAELVDDVHKPPFRGLIDAQLWRAELPDDEPVVMVRCRNSTREPDGTFKHYWLRVPPDVSSAHEALAWTYGISRDEYRPLVES